MHGRTDGWMDGRQQENIKSKIIIEEKKTQWEDPQDLKK